MKYFLLLCIVVYSIGCVSTRVSSIVAPTHGQYHKVLLEANYKDLELKKNYELALSYTFHDNSVTAYRSVDVFPPLEDYSDSEIVAKLQELGIDAILTLAPDGESTSTSTSYDQLTNSYNTHQSLDDIYVVAELRDVRTGKIIYKASISTGLSDYASVPDARQSAADKLFNDLALHHFFAHGQSEDVGSN